MMNQQRRGTTAAVALAVLAVLMAVPAVFVAADDASVVYLEGDPELRRSAGGTDWLDFGSVLRTGDSVVTGRGDFVELEQGGAASIRVNANTVFTIREVERGGQRENVMTTSVGSVSMRFNQVAGRRQPSVATNTTVAGVRGTELTVYAAADGSSMFLVESGLVEVSSEGRTVELSENQAVEVALGQPPGEIFEWKGRELDFSSWNNDRLNQYLVDPAAGTAALMSQLDEFIAGVAEYYELYGQFASEYNTEFERFQQMADGEEKEELRQQLFLLGDATTTQALNFRYYALSGLSLRRFVLGRLYLELRTRYILDRQAPEYLAFMEKYREFLSSFEEGIVPRLVEADI